MKDVFPLSTSSNYNISNRPTFYSMPLNSVYNGIDSLSNLAPKMWELVSNGISALESLLEFKNVIKL